VDTFIKTYFSSPGPVPKLQRVIHCHSQTILTVPYIH